MSSIDHDRIPRGGKHTLTGTVCLCLDGADAHKVLLGRYDQLGIDIQGVLYGLCASNHIERIDIGIVPSLQGRTSQNFSLFGIKTCLRRIGFRLAHIVDIIETFLSDREKITGITLDNLAGLPCKLGEVVLLSQDKKSYYTCTYPCVNAGELRYDLFIRGSGLGIEKELGKPLYSRIGLLSLHHGDSRICRGLPAGFWEVCKGLSSGIIAQLVDIELDAGRIVAAGRIATIQNPSENMLSIYRYTGPCIQMALNSIYTGSSPITDYWNHCDLSFPYTHPLNKAPSTVLRFYVSIKCLVLTIGKLPLRILRKVFRRYTLLLDICWNVAITGQKARRIDKWAMLNASSSRWFADPFISKVEDRFFLLMEKFSCETRGGVICSREILRNSGSFSLGNEDIVLKNSKHLSFPFTFERNGKSYLIPENSDNGCRLYELFTQRVSSEVHLKAREVKLLLEGDWRDPVLLSLEGIDYLFVSSQCSNQASVLHIFMSSNILSDDIIEHESSPCCIDHTLGRNAGRIWKIFLRDGSLRLIRPSQKSVGSYGQGVSLSDLKIGSSFVYISELSDLYGEVLNKTKYSKMHHVELREDMMAIDYKSH